jgi:hypothetical protein
MHFELGDRGGGMLYKEYLETARTLHRAALKMTDRMIAGQLRALAEDCERRAEKAAQADTAKAPALGGLKSSFPKSRSKARLQAARAAQLAEGTLGKIEDPAAPPQKRAQRKRKLTIGPHEFREYRIDQPEEYSSVRFASGDMTETPVPGACVAQADGAKLDD